MSDASEEQVVEALDEASGQLSVISDDIVDDESLVSQDSNEPAKLIKQLPFSFAQTHGVLLDLDAQAQTLLEKNPRSPVTVLHRKELSLDILLEVRRYLHRSMVTQEVDDNEFQKRLTQAFQKSSSEAQQAVEEIDADFDLSRLADEIPESADLMADEEDAPVIRLINAILSQAVRDQASDIHIETFEEALVIRFRIDGVLSEVLRPKRMLAPLLVSRLKVMSKLDIAEKRIPQDGRISIRLAGHAVDIRLSTNPTAYGERIVLRLLDKQAGQLDLNQLNMAGVVEQGYKRILAYPHGIVLVTGPTGSGKTTTLYAGLTYINDESRNILTIEDPVEYLLPGIGQTQVNAKVDMTFSRGLRAILRQDPDVVMIGEIRDIETAQIAVQASLTGHLVLSTLHTNTAVGAITRLSDMGIEPFLLASSLSAVIAQRLVRKLCPHCRESYVANEKEKSIFSHLVSDDNPVTLHKAVGCKECNYQGYRGRSGIYEYIEVNDSVRKFIHDGASEQIIESYIRENHPSIRDDGLLKVLAGQTTIEEVLRVTSG